MYTQKQFSCLVIGEGTLSIQCAELILERGHRIFGVISPEAAVRDWAKGKNIPHIHPTDNQIGFLSQQPVDYLFSIANNSSWPRGIRKLPCQLVINYHEAPLPRYGGVNATSWALMHREKTHGVTWHVMIDRLNAIDILKQFSIDIAEDETAFPLNGKCYMAAIHTFAQLIDDLSSGSALASKHTLDEQAYLRHSKRLSAAGILSLNRCAHDIDACIRALDFGPYPNPLGLAKLAIGSDLLVVTKIEVTGDLSQSPPGGVTAIEPYFLKVSTASYEVALLKVLTIDGQPLSIPDLVTRFGIQVGDRFFDIDPDMARRIEQFDALIAQHETFWVERLATLQPISLPYAQAKAAHLQQKQHTSVKVPVPHEVTTFLEERYPAGNHGDVLFAAFAAYLGRIGGTGSFDIGFRDVELQRQLVGLEGCFASHVPCRLDIDYKQRFEDVFAAIREQVELTRLHFTYARDAVARYPALHSLLELGREQLFPVLVERVEKLDDHPAGFGNELTLVIPSDGKECCWRYNASALDGDSIARMLDQFATFLQGIVTDPVRPVAYQPLLSEQEHHKILVEWNETQADYPLDKCIHQLFEAQVERTPDAVSVIFEDTQLTYRALNARANQLAHHLQKLGVGPEVVVGICIERSHQMVVGVLGILKAGGAYLPLDTRAPKARLSYMLEDAKARVLLTQQELVNNFSEYGGHLVCLDTDWDAIATGTAQRAIATQNANNPTSEVTTDNLAYVMYTSGSTGEPKGVQVEHRSLGNLATAARTQSFNLRPDSRVLQYAPLHFGASVPDIFMTLLVGATLYLAKQESLLPGLGLTRLLRDQAITNAKFTPSVLAAMPEDELPALQTIAVSGEPCSAELVARWATGRQFVIFYGATELTSGGAVAKCIDGSRKPPIGRPLANTQIYLLDSHLQPVPIGVPGEVHIGGLTLARGYLNRPDLTTQRFIPHPFSNEPGTRLYKTGDLARYLPDGNIMHLGRIDNQIKIRGQRIELEEIETVLAQQEAVEATVVIDREDVPGDKRLVAYVVLKQNQAATREELHRFLKQKLPDYMIPSAFVFLKNLPLNSNGKIDRRALPAPEKLRPDLSITFAAPRTPIEQQIADIWTKVLKLEQVGIHDNFFEIGGHSLLATQVMSSLLQAFGVELHLHNLFEFPTVAELAKRIETVRLVQSDEGEI